MNRLNDVKIDGLEKTYNFTRFFLFILTYNLAEEERAGCFTVFVFLLLRDY